MTERLTGRIRCVVLDRDGTLIRHVPYLHDPAGVELLPTVVEGLTMLRELGCRLFLHTNQSGVGRGLFSHDDVVACNEALLEQLGMGSGLFERICIAPEAPDQTVLYRKPSPRFGQELMAAYAFTPEEMCYVGDNVSDLLAAQALGCAGAGVNTGLHDLTQLLDERGMEGAFPVFDTFVQAAQHVANGCR
jgi:D-glycero-D-manno-heptose 1,7-bisphosphate phosphatase